MGRIKIAVTGGIGSGKSLALSVIKDLGYMTVSLDEVYKELLKDEKFVLEICDLTGISPAEENGKKVLDKKKLSDIVFSDSGALKRLNGFTHPRIIKRAFELYPNEDKVFYEVPLLFEGGYEKLFDRVLVITRDRDVRKDSVAKRDGRNAEDIKKRMDSQTDYDNLVLSPYTVIKNDGDMDAFKSRVKDALKKLI